MRHAAAYGSYLRGGKCLGTLANSSYTESASTGRICQAANY